MRYGLPFRSARKEGATGALFEAIKKDSFDLEAGGHLEQAQKASRAKRQRAVKNMGREEVLERMDKAAPKTRKEWLEFVLAERLQAVQDYRNEEKLKARVATQQKLARRSAEQITRS
jgi:hypothetical protein